MPDYDPDREDFRQQDQSMSAKIDAHDENLKRWVEAGCCPKCRRHHMIELNPKNITFRCSSQTCGWFAIYPIARIVGSSPAWQCECFHWNGITVPRCNNCGQAKPALADPFPLEHPPLRSCSEQEGE